MIVELDVDARQVLFPIYLGPSYSGSITLPEGSVDNLTPDSTKTILKYSLNTEEAGLYQVWVMDAVRGEIVFNLTPEGEITIYTAPGPYYQLSKVAEGRWSLAIPGFPVTLDGRYITGKGIVALNVGIPNTNVGPFRVLKGGIIPASPEVGYAFEQEWGLNCVTGFNVDLQGNISYPGNQDVLSGGPFQGRGTNTLQLLGIPVLLDVRAVTESGSIILNSTPVPNTCDPAVAFVNLLPLAGTGSILSIGVSDIPAAVATFQVDGSGNVTAEGINEYEVLPDTFHGVVRLSVYRRLVFHPAITTRAADHV